MPQNRDQLERELRAKAEEAIQNLLKALPDDASEVSLSDLEDVTGEMGRSLMQGTMVSLSQTQQPEVEAVWCEACQQKMQKRGKRKKRVETVRGEIEIERQYYVCPQCGAGAFPPR